MTQKTKKNSAARKLVPAAGMLAVSAMMLATSTYAWFTMSREVEVNNIKMTATVPADMQISLGMLNGITLGAGHGLGDNYGTLAFSGTSADNGGVTAPDGTAEYWSNSADVSAYYALGKIMPASSTDGKNVYFTPDAAGVGKTLKAGANYYKAVEGSTKYYDDGTTAAGADSRETTLHAYTTTEKPVGGSALSDTDSDLWAKKDTDGYTAATSWDDTNDDGYYVDIPVWIRTSCKDTGGVPLAVDAYVTSSSKNDDDDLYLAARAVILNADKSATSKLLEIRPDSYTNAADGTPNNETIVDFMSSTNAIGEAVSAVDENKKATYNTVGHYTGTADVVTVDAAPANETYGAAKQVWVRVWLEGEDPNCWNENAGQDFSINLKFTRDRMYNTAALSTAPAGTTQTYPDANSQLVDTDGQTADANNALKIGDQVKVTGAFASTFEWDGAKWVNRGTFTKPAMGRHYTANGDGNIHTEAELITWLNTNITDKGDIANVTLAAADDTNPTQIVATVNNGAATYSVSALPNNVVKFTVNGKEITATTEEPAKTAAENLALYLADLANGKYTITLAYS